MLFRNRKLIEPGSPPTCPTNPNSNSNHRPATIPAASPLLPPGRWGAAAAATTTGAFSSSSSSRSFSPRPRCRCWGTKTEGRRHTRAGKFGERLFFALKPRHWTTSQFVHRVCFRRSPAPAGLTAEDEAEMLALLGEGLGLEDQLKGLFGDASGFGDAGGARKR